MELRAQCMSAFHLLQMRLDSGQPSAELRSALQVRSASARFFNFMRMAHLLPNTTRLS